MKPLVTIALILGYWVPTIDELFRRIKSQKFKHPYEIVAVYHGKDEHTYKKLTSLVSKVVRIKPEEYNGGVTRDLACSLASGKYIVNVSVDSLPFNNSWLQNMVEPLMNNEADVVQGMQQCPENGDFDYHDCFYWERDYSFCFTSEGLAFYKKYGFLSKRVIGVCLPPTYLLKKRFGKKQDLPVYDTMKIKFFKKE